ncbi:MAG: hypothetical protein QOF83_1701 [Solirubrobacteraceae bacterium]|nr:hypothetical protein [Solirubrobacteraceae bacterium]
MFENPFVAVSPRLRVAVIAVVCSLAGLVGAASPPAHARSLSHTRHRSCPVAVAAGHAHTRSRPPCVAGHHGRKLALRNAFGQALFGIATGSTLQNEATSPALLSRDLGDDHSAGARWIRLDINWAQIQMHGPGTYLWTYIDAAVRRAEADGMQVLGTITYTPAWARPASTDATWGPDPQLYARFAAAAVAHYSRLGVQAYEIWNEPNSQAFWTPRPSPVAYTTLLRSAYSAIKRVDPGATVLTGGTAPAATDGIGYSPVSFLAGIYASGGQGSFDAVANHPYCWPAYPGAKKSWSAWYQMYGTKRSLRSLMISHGDGAKKIWATEFGAPTNGPAGTYVSKATQAKMVTRAYRLFASYRWAGPLFFYSSRDLGSSTSTRENFFGFLTRNFARKPSFTAYRRVMLSVRSLVMSRRAK